MVKSKFAKLRPIIDYNRTGSIPVLSIYNLKGLYTELKNFMTLPVHPQYINELIKNFVVNFGPQHFAAYSVLRLVLGLNSEIVERTISYIATSFLKRLFRRLSNLISRNLPSKSVFTRSSTRRTNIDLLPNTLNRDTLRIDSALAGNQVRAQPFTIFRDRPDLLGAIRANRMAYIAERRAAQAVEQGAAQAIPQRALALRIRR